MFYTSLTLSILVLLASNTLGSRHKRVVGGDIIPIEDAPYNLALEYRGMQICGGAILSELWGITAAHCFGKLFYMSQGRIRAGSALRAQGGTLHTLLNVIHHPDFKFSEVNNDAALIQVNPPFVFSNTIAPIALSSPLVQPKNGDILNVFGWGYTMEKGQPSKELRYVGLPIFPHGECKELYQDTLNVTDQMICAGYKDGGKDACLLDSGGPFVWEGALRGIVSWGWGCARASRPGVFTDLGAPAIHYWILNTMKNTITPPLIVE